MKIDKIEIRNFKRFKRLTLPGIPNNCVFVGVNGSGKTTLLQAFSTWSMLFYQWLEKTDLDATRDSPDQDYSSVSINRLLFYSIPLAKFSDLWTEQKTDEPVYISLKMGALEAAFEVIYDNDESAKIRPHKDTKKSILEKAQKLPAHQKLFVIYIPHFSAIQRQEKRNADNLYVIDALSQGHPGAVFRNLLVNASRKKSIWDKLCDVAKEGFNIELNTPTTANGLVIKNGYRHIGNQGTISSEALDFTTAASGFLQVMTIYASMLLHKGSAIVIDEPASHLHPLLQKNIMQDLKKCAIENENQLIVADHASDIIGTFDPKQMGIITDNGIVFGHGAKEEKKQIFNILNLSTSDITLAGQQNKMLYVEGHIDRNIVRAWAKTMDHKVAAFLDSNAWIEKRDILCDNDVLGHFGALKSVLPKVRGFYLRDGDNRQLSNNKEIYKNDLMTYSWHWYSIESYLINWRVLERYFVRKGAPKTAIKKAQRELQDNVPPGIFKNPRKDNKSNFLNHISNKTLLSNVLEIALLPLQKKSERFSDDALAVKIAQTMRQNEIPGEVEKLLDTMAKHLQISE